MTDRNNLASTVGTRTIATLDPAPPHTPGSEASLRPEPPLQPLQPLQQVQVPKQEGMGMREVQPRRLHVWTDHQVVLLLRAAVALKMDPNSVGWGKMTGCYAERARMLREAPGAAEEWGPNMETTLTVSKIRSKFESVSLLLASHKFRVRSKDPEVREEVDRLYGQLRALQASRVVVSPQDALKRWRDGLEHLRQAWTATRKTDIPKSRVQAALKAIRDLKKLRPQLNTEGNCVFPPVVLLNDKTDNDDDNDDDDQATEGDTTVDAAADAECAAGTNNEGTKEGSDSAEGSVAQQAAKGPDNAATPLTGATRTFPEDKQGATKEFPSQQKQYVAQSKGPAAAEAYEPESKKARMQGELPSETTCKELIALLQTFVENASVLCCLSHLTHALECTTTITAETEQARTLTPMENAVGAGSLTECY